MEQKEVLNKLDYLYAKYEKDFYLLDNKIKINVFNTYSYLVNKLIDDERLMYKKLFMDMTISLIPYFVYYYNDTLYLDFIIMSEIGIEEFFNLLDSDTLLFIIDYIVKPKACQEIKTIIRSYKYNREKLTIIFKNKTDNGVFSFKII
jgi:hypothetical protein